MINIETNTIYSTYTQFNQNDDSEGWPRYKLSTEQMKDLDTLSFKVIVSLIDVYDKNGCAITEKFTNNDDEEKQIDQEPITYPSQNYQWQLCGDILQQVKNAKNGEIVQSGIFMIGRIKWMAEMYPNGANKSSIGWSGWYLNLISFPSNLSKIVFQFKIVLFDENKDKAIVRAGRTYTVEHSDSTVWWGSKRVELKDLRECKELNFYLEITVLELFDNDGNKIINHENGLFLNLSTDKSLTMIDEYIWRIMDIKKIQNVQNGIYFDSDTFKIFGLEWYLRVYPNGIDKTSKGEAKLQLYLKGLHDEIESVSLQFQFEIEETQTLYFNFANFRGKHLSKGWRTSYLKTKELMELKEKLSIKVIITIINMYDKDGYKIGFEDKDNDKISDRHKHCRFVSYSKFNDNSNDNMDSR